MANDERDKIRTLVKLLGYGREELIIVGDLAAPKAGKTMNDSEIGQVRQALEVLAALKYPAEALAPLVHSFQLNHPRAFRYEFWRVMLERASQTEQARREGK